MAMMMQQQPQAVVMQVGGGGMRSPQDGAWTFTCSDCCGEACCAVACCSCCVYGAFYHMMETGVYQEPCCSTCNGMCWAMCAGYVMWQGFANYFFPGSGMLIGILAPFQIICGLPTRTQLRNKYNLPEECCPDCLLWWFFPMCAMCQEYKEVHARITTTGNTVIMMQQPMQPVMPMMPMQQVQMVQQPMAAPSPFMVK